MINFRDKIRKLLLIFHNFCCKIKTEEVFFYYPAKERKIIMVRIIIGLKGSGKTKHLIELANKAVETSPGNVVCIEKGNKLMFDVRHQVRLVDTDVFGVSGADQLFGMVCGIISANYDIKDIFIDSSLKICKDDKEEFVKLIEALNKITTAREINLVTTASIDAADFPVALNKYIL